MSHHARLLLPSRIGQVLVVAGHLGDQVEELVAAEEHPGLEMTLIHEDEQNGTVAALRLAADADLDADRFLVILGDILMSFPVDGFLTAWHDSGKSVAVAVHPSTHPEDSDAVFTGDDGFVTVRAKGDRDADLPNSSSAGLFAITRDGLERFGHTRDFGSDLLPAAAAEGALYAHVSSHYFKDTGTPQRLAAANADVASGCFARRGSLTPRPALFLDRDGVINPADPEVYEPAQYRLNPGVAEAIAVANKRGLPVLVATNQPGLAKGFMSSQTHTAIRAEMDRQLAEQGAFVDDYAFCPHHPDAGFPGEVPGLKVECDCRKPAPGLLTGLAARHGIDFQRSIMVGDTWRDEEAAQAAGASFLSVDANTGVGACEVITQAIEELTC
jgi:histidinol-phosphate phosphatase family protein